MCRSIQRCRVIYVLFPLSTFLPRWISLHCPVLSVIQLSRCLTHVVVFNRATQWICPLAISLFPSFQLTLFFFFYLPQLIILEDYADPFDAEQAGSTQTTTEKVTTENDGYMEPYEAQKMMAGRSTLIYFCGYSHWSSFFAGVIISWQLRL